MRTTGFTKSLAFLVLFAANAVWSVFLCTDAYLDARAVRPPNVVALRSLELEEAASTEPAPEREERAAGFVMVAAATDTAQR